MPEVVDILADLRRRIADAQSRGNLTAIAQLRHRQLVARVEGVVRLELMRIIRPALERVELRIYQLATNGGSPETYTSLIETLDELLGTIYRWFARSQYATAQQTREDAQNDWLPLFGVAALRAMTGVPIDATGLPKPKPGAVPAVIRDRTLTTAEILDRISPLVVVPGDRHQVERTPVIDLVFGPRRDSLADEAAIAVESSVVDVSRPWREKVQWILDELKRSIVRIVDELLRIRSEIKQSIDRARSEFERAQTALLIEAQHEALKTRGTIYDRMIAETSPDVVVGYTLHSRFYPTTAPDHAARDGWKFYRDDRPGSNLPWSQRLIPPYRKNCLCFTVPILQEPEGDEYHAEFGLRISGGKVISVREVGTFAEWFDHQIPSVQQKLVGTQRWMAAASRGNGRPRYRDFVTRRGQIMSPRTIVNESVESYTRRSREVEIIMDAQKRRAIEAWESGAGKFDLDERAEAEYRRRLMAFLARATA